MERNKNGIVIGIMLGIILMLAILVTLLITDTINLSFAQKASAENKEQNDYKEFKVNEEVRLKDGSEWIVIEESSKESDYVTMIEKESDDIMNQNTYELLWSEIADSEIKYNDSNLKKYVDSLANNIPAKLKEVNGYKIRLITVEEIMNLYKDWTYDEVYDNYTYFGNDLNLSTFIGLTMTTPKCTEGKCTSFYIVSGYYDDNQNYKYYIAHWAVGLPEIKPVINVYKTEIES